MPAGEFAGRSFAGTISDPDARSRHTEQYTECVGNRGYYRDGREAVTVRQPMTPFSAERWQLFDDENDPAQSRDVSAESPELVGEVGAPGGGVWNVTVSADGRQVLSVRDLVQFSGFLPFEGVDAGIDRRSPVSWDLYRRRGTFPFTGEIRGVTYVPGERCPDAPERRLHDARVAGLGLQ